ncbi:MAG TPA: hypothetical protein VI006_17135 [Solirubrobacteraceae bacterium]
MASQAQEKARDADDEARGRMRDQVDQWSTQPGERVRSSASDVGSVADQQRKQGKDARARYVEQAADRGDARSDDETHMPSAGTPDPVSVDGEVQRRFGWTYRVERGSGGLRQNGTWSRADRHQSRVSRCPASQRISSCGRGGWARVFRRRGAAAR